MTSSSAQPVMSAPSDRTRSVFWDDSRACVGLIDQRLLPAELVLVYVVSVGEVVRVIKDMTVRGAPAIGAAGGFGVALAANASAAASVAELMADLTAAKAELDASRPTAVNLSWATGRLVEFAQAMADMGRFSVADVRARVLTEAKDLAEEDVRINKRMAEYGSTVVSAGANILHHCNTGALATVDIGTAIGVIYECHRTGKGVHVWVDETRPRLQGARLTAWELMREGVPMHLIADNAAGHVMSTGKVDVLLYGADRVSANGDVANKIGTYQISVVACENRIPVYPVVPTSTIDLTVATGSDIHIEERAAEEVTVVGGVRVAPEGVRVYNPAFDVTPAKYITGIVTEEGICYPPFNVSLALAKETAEKRIRAQWVAKLEELAKA